MANDDRKSLTPRDLAYMFWRLNDEEQAVFFSSIADAATSDGLCLDAVERQMGAVRDRLAKSEHEEGWGAEVMSLIGGFR